MSDDRLYRVKAKKDGLPKDRMVQAGSQSQVAKFLVNDLYDIAPASPLDVAEFFANSNGQMKVEKANGNGE